MCGIVPALILVLFVLCCGFFISKELDDVPDDEDNSHW